MNNALAENTFNS